METRFNDPRINPVPQGKASFRPFAGAKDKLEELLDHCRTGRLYEVEAWIKGGKPLQLDPAAVPKRPRIKSALEIALKAGNHSLCQILLCNGYSVELEADSPLNLALQTRRWDLADLLLAWGAAPHRVDLTTLFDTYNRSLF